MNRNKVEMKYVILIILLLITILLAILSLTVNDKRKLTPVEGIVKDTVIGIERFIAIPFKFVSDKIHEYSSLKGVYKENKSLKQKIDKYDLVKTQNEELKRQINELKATLHLDKTLVEYTSLNATVVNRNVGYWYNTITIDKGTYNGIKEDMAVITDKGLIGAIIKPTNFSSEVKLITNSDINNKISIAIDVNGQLIYGLLEGYNTKENLLVIDGIINNIEIPKGSKVITSGLGGIFPSGILVGYVAKTNADQYGLSKKVMVKATVDFNDIHFVTILKRRGS